METSTSPCTIEQDSVACRSRRLQILDAHNTGVNALMQVTQAGGGLLWRPGWCTRQR